MCQWTYFQQLYVMFEINSKHLFDLAIKIFQTTVMTYWMAPKNMNYYYR